MSTRPSRFLHAALVVALAIVAASAVTAVGKPAALPALPTPIVAIINLPKVLEGLKEREARKRDLSVAADDAKKKKEEYTKTLEAEKAAIGLMADNADKLAAGNAFREKAIRLDFEVDFTEKLLVERETDALRDLCNKILASAGRLAQSRGYHMVVSTDAAVPLNGNADDITRTISLKRIIYSSPELDITDELVAFMNNEHATGGTAPAVPAPAPK